MVVAANRDERYDRPSAAPGLLNSAPKMIAGKDLRAGGTWLGVNEHGVVAAILNRRSNGVAVAGGDVRSRGLLCMDLLNQQSAAAAGAFIGQHRERYNPFAALVADRTEAIIFYNNDGKIFAQPLRPGLHVFSSAAEFDLQSAKAERAHRLFARFDDQRMRTCSWVKGLQSVLADHTLSGACADPGDAVCVHRRESGTVSAGIIRIGAINPVAEFLHCEGAPCANSFAAVHTLEVS